MYATAKCTRTEAITHVIIVVQLSGCYRSVLRMYLLLYGVVVHTTANCVACRLMIDVFNIKFPLRASLREHFLKR